MDKERYEKGLAMRKAVLGEAHVERSLANADDFTRPFQEVITAVSYTHLTLPTIYSV